MTRIKICCISTIAEAQMAVAYGADALGLVGPMPSGPGVLTNEQIAQIVPAVPPPIATFLLTSETSAQGIIAHYKQLNTSAIQIVDQLKEGSYTQIHEALPMVKLVQVIHVINEESVEEAIRISAFVDAILLDSGNPNLQVKELGGTGRVHNWKLSRKIVESINKPVFLAGGIKAENAKEAIEIVQPFGLDLCSSVRTNGQLDEQKLKQFFDAIAGL